jgi:hypothetical protein
MKVTWPAKRLSDNSGTNDTAVAAPDQLAVGFVRESKLGDACNRKRVNQTEKNCGSDRHQSCG